MGLEWVLLGLLLGIALWLGVDACRESKRLHERLSKVRVDEPLLVEGDSLRSPRVPWAYFPMTTSVADDGRLGPRL
jgi:hypothetical protein